MTTSPAKLLHKSVKILGTIVSTRSGWLAFDAGTDEQFGDGFRSAEFRRYPEGTRMECLFRVNEGRRQLLHAKPTEVSVDEPITSHWPSIEETLPAPMPPEPVFPSSIGDYFVPESARALLAVICKIVNDGGHVNLLTRGQSGYGKTALYQALGDYLEYDVVMINCAAIMDTEQWFGYQEARAGETVFFPSEFSEAIMKGHCVVVLDEANRIEPWLANSLLPMLDYRRSTTVHNVRIDAGPAVVFGHTINEGAKFAGTHVMDAAYMNRIDATLEIGPMPTNKEVDQLARRYDIDSKVARQIVGLNTSLRSVIERERLDIDASTRTSLKIAALVKYGLSVKLAFDYVVVNATPIEDRKAVIDLLNQSLTSIPGGYK